ncbi:hypothetical protein pdam_00015814 [Pocillopora damicornis]|uniref:Uncharacterized protein n=1 Tax=Pocillopora damicornis TaxID=46731 RepID=A0A3M6T5P6_POCDA|nr:hypothetical protein pdam_00015814 [Pocillopora damicornis]
MSESASPETGDLVDFSSGMEDEEDVSSTTPYLDDITKDEPPPEGENVPDEREETPAVEDPVSEQVESEEKPEEPATKDRGQRRGGPVQFEKEEEDHFGLDKFLTEA